MSHYVIKYLSKDGKHWYSHAVNTNDLEHAKQIANVFVRHGHTVKLIHVTYTEVKTEIDLED